MEKSQSARCIHCRSEVAVPDAYAHGDHIKCGSCGTKHKVSRGEILRLVLADTAPVREALQANEALVERIEDELLGARRSFGIGVNGFGIGVLYVISQVMLEDKNISRELLINAAAIAAVSGIALELANFFFLAKRREMSRISGEIAEATREINSIQQKIRESLRR